MAETPGTVRRRVAKITDPIKADAALGPVLPTYTVAGLPAAADNEGRMVRVSDGATGQPCVAISNGTSWLRIVLGAAVAAA